MSAYRTLSQMAYEAYEQGDDVRATLFAKILEQVWLKEVPDLRSVAPRMRQRIDAAMREFITPILHYAGGHTERPDFNTEAAAYGAYQDALKLLENQLWL